ELYCDWKGRRMHRRLSFSHYLLSSLPDLILLEAFGLRFRLGDLLLLIHGKEQIMAEAQTPVHPPSLPIAVQFGALRQPHVHIALPEVHRSIVNNRVIAQKADFWQWCD